MAASGELNSGEDVSGKQKAPPSGAFRKRLEAMLYWSAVLPLVSPKLPPLVPERACLL